MTGAAVAVLALLVALTCGAWHGTVWTIYAVCVLAFAVTVAVGPLRRQRDRAVWVSVAVGVLLLTVAEAVLMVSWDGSRSGILQALGDHGLLAVAGLCGYVGLYAGQMLILRQRVRELLPSAWFDGVHTTTVLAAVCAAWVTAPVRSATGLDTLGTVALVGRPVLDLLLFSVALAMCSILGWRSERTVTLIMVAFGLLLVSDVVSVLWVCGVLVGPGWGLAILLTHVGVLGVLGVAALGRGRRSSGRVQVAWSSMASPLAMLLLSGVLLGVDHLNRLPAPTTALALAGLAGVGVKVCMVFQEVLRLAESHDQALTDELTQLPNRRAFNLALAARTGVRPGPGSSAGNSARNSERRTVGSSSAEVAVLLIDLDRFKEVNDSYGHAHGDALLQEVAVRVAERLPVGAVLARLGGDEFAVLLPGMGLQEAAVAATEVLQRLGRPLRLRSVTMTIGASIGIAGWPLEGWSDVVGPSVSSGHVPVSGVTSQERRGDSWSAETAEARGISRGISQGVWQGAGAEELLRRADVAMYSAKRAGGGIARYDAAADERTRAERVLMRDLDFGLGAGELVNHYQPQVDVRTGQVTGMEALVRWQHPVRGLLGPAVFLDLAEENGFMGALTTTVLRQATADAVAWHRAGWPVRISVNLATSCLLDPELPLLVEQVMGEAGLDPTLLVLEITETTLMQDPDRSRETITGLLQLGASVSIDDYGTGYSSLAYLQDLPAAELKLDRSFTQRLGSDPRTGQIIKSTTDLAHSLGLRMLVEGVEDAVTVQRLRELGVDESQGYHHSRPMPAEQVLAWLQRAELARATDVTVAGLAAES